jgi:hypothetical protein
MQPRRPYEYLIELRQDSFLHSRVKSFLLVLSIGSIAGCGYFLAHSPTFQQMFKPEFEPPIAATLPQPPKRSGQNPDTKSQDVRSPDFRAPIAPSGAMTAAAAAVPSPYSASKSVGFTAPSAVHNSPTATSYTSPDLAAAAHQPYVAPPQGQVLGASTYDTDARFADLQNQIDALAQLPRSVFVPSFSGPAASTPVNTQTFAVAQKIDHLANISVNGVSGLTDADIPDSLTASNYLPLTGGTLSGSTTLDASLTVNGDLTMSGTLTAGALSVAALSSSGGVIGPFIQATSTSATSTFEGGFSAMGNVALATTTITGPLTVQGWGDPDAFHITSAGNVGIGTTSPSDVLHIYKYDSDSIGGIIENPYSGGRVKLTLKSYTTEPAYIDWGHTSYDLNIVSGRNNFGNIALKTLTSGVEVDRLHILNNGNVGIGSTTPWGKLSITGSGSGTGIAFAVADNANSPKVVVQDNGNVGIGTTTPLAKLHVGGGPAFTFYGSANIPTSAAVMGYGNIVSGAHLPGDSAYVGMTGFQDTSNYSLAFTGMRGTFSGNASDVASKLELLTTLDNNPQVRMTIDTAGNVGIGATSPDMLLSVGSNSPTGAVAHFENSTGSCYINPTNTALSCSSDARLKTNITPLPDADGLDALLKLGPVTFNWKNESATSSHHSGFIAQEVQQVLPDLVSQGPDGYYTMNYAGLVTYIVKAVQELASQLSDITNTVTSFAERFVTKELVATNGTFDHLTAKTLCVEDICVSRDQLAALLAAAGQSGASSSWTQSSTASTMPATSSSPVISVNGNNPAHINVGDSYSDLGARIIGPTEADTNLGLRYFVDGALVPFVSLDTSTSTTYVIEYVAENATGTSTSTRTVIVQAHEQMTFAQPTPPPPEEATSSAATSTSATTTPQ